MDSPPPTGGGAHPDAGGQPPGPGPGTPAEASPLIVWRARPDGAVASFNGRWHAYTGLTPEKSVGWGWERAIHPDDRPYGRDRWRAALAAGEEFEVEFHFRRRDGASRLNLASGLPVRDGVGEIVEWVGIFTGIEAQGEARTSLRRLQDELEDRVAAATARLRAEVAEHRRVEEALREGGERFRCAFERAPVGMVIASPEGRSLHVNRSMVEILGGPREEWLGITDATVTHPDDVEAESARFRELVDGRVASIRYEKRFLHEGGRPDWADLSVSIIRDAQGTPRYALALIEDVTCRKEAEVAQEEQTEVLRSILDHIGDAVIVADAGGRLRSFNPAAERMFGPPRPDLDPGEWPGHYGFFLPDGVTPFPAAEIPLTRAIGGESVNDVEGTRRKPGLPDLDWCVSSARPIRDEGGRVIGGVAVCQDVTARRQGRLDAQGERDRLVEVSRLKSEFLANMSHEIRTPMGGILGMTDLLMTTPLDDEQRDYAATIRQGADALLAILNDILDNSKIEAGKLALEAVPLDLGTLLEDVADLLAPVAHPKGLRITCKVPPDFPGLLAGDPVRLRQILTNLAGNAVKFTESGEVVLAAEILGRAGDDVSLRLTVRDTGIGIPRHRQDAVFESFTQSDGGIGRRFGGTGLGLTICRRLAHLMGGTIGLDSEPGRGSTFRVELALKAVPSPERSRPELPAGLRTLVVSDDPTTRDLVVEHLRARGCRAESAADGPEAFGRLVAAISASDPFALAILDEGADTWATTEAIKVLPRREGLPLVLLHARGSKPPGRSARSLRFAATLSRPIRRGRLDEAVAEAIGVRADRPAETADSLGGGPPPGLRVLLAEDNEVNRKVARRILQRWGCVVDAVEDGRAAIEAIGRTPYDVVLMDVQMPVLDGLAATAEVRRRERETGRHVPILAMTAHAMPGDRDRCLAAGMDDYLAKPVRPPSLREALAHLIPAAGDTVAAPWRSDRLREAGGDDGEFEREVLAAFRDEAPALLDALAATLAAGDAPGALAAAHSLKGICLTIGADSLAADFRAVEGEAAGGQVEAARSALLRLGPHWRGLLRSLENEVGT